MQHAPGKMHVCTIVMVGRRRMRRKGLDVCEAARVKLDLLLAYEALSY
jgi:hypothetical protein